MAFRRTAAVAPGPLAPSGAPSGRGGADASGRERADGSGARRLPEADLRIGFAGDVMLGRGVDRVHADGAPTGVWGTMYGHLCELDGFVGNLECVLSERGEPWPDKRFHFRARPDWALDALDAIDADALALGNNHAMDFGADALVDTVAHLDAAGIGHAGAGEDIDAALQPALVEIGDLTVGMVGFVDHWEEFAAGPDQPGTAYAELDVENERTRGLVDDALERAACADPDLLVASLHAGYNYDTHPSESLRRFAHWLVDRGVDVLHGHSAHIVQGVEVYDGAPLLYDAGEFVDDYADHERYHNDRSYLFELVLDGEDPFLRLVPTEIENYRVHRATDDAAAYLERTIRERSEAFGTEFETTDDPAVLRVPLAQ